MPRKNPQQFKTNFFRKSRTCKKLLKFKNFGQRYHNFFHLQPIFFMCLELLSSNFRGLYAKKKPTTIQNKFFPKISDLEKIAKIQKLRTAIS